ncbi:MAG: hypothetical protein SFU25_07600 [Candidatus Caenarcaniphilales bacterium]|nr:hypothetical protein [Candidatus Caenarcaniphilales bacterium]
MKGLFTEKVSRKLLGVVIPVVISLGLNLASSTGVFAQANVTVGDGFTGTAAVSPVFNNNQIQTQNSSQNLNQIQVSSISNSRAGIIGPAVGAGAAATVVGSPSAFANTHLFNGPWNFTPPNLLFHCSKTINDGSVFSACRIVNVGANLRRGIKDRLFGIYDEREFIASGVPGGGIFAGGAIIACGLNTQLPAGCVTYMGTGYVFMEEYGTTEAALVALSRMAARNGANIVGNVNCAFAETIRTYTTSLGAAFGFSDGVGSDGAVSGSLGATWGTSRVKRPVQPHCSGDFYMGSASGCYAMGMNQTYFPQPIPYRRYLPPPQMNVQGPAYQQPVRGLW